MKVSDCCGANFYEPGYPDSDICTDCGEHAGPMEEEEDLLVPHKIEKPKSMISCIGYREEE